MSLHSLPLFVRMDGRPVMLLGHGEAADAKRRLLERAGAEIVGEDSAATLAIVAIDDEGEALAAIDRLKVRGILVNAVDRPEHCDFTLPAIVDRDPVIVAIGTGGVSAGLAAALRQRLEALLPASLGALAAALHAARGPMRARYSESGERRRALGGALAAGAILDPLDGDDPAARVDRWLTRGGQSASTALVTIRLRSPDPDELTLREARALAQADRVYHAADTAPAILDRARADAARIIGPAPDPAGPGLSVMLAMA